MLLMTSASDLVRVITGTTGSDIEVHTSWVDNNAGTITLGRTNTASIVTNTTTTVVASPATGQRNVKHINIRNNHATVETAVTVDHTDGTNVETLFYVGTLAAGESITLDQSGAWTHYDANGAEYVRDGSTHSAVASRAEAEAGTSLLRAVTPGRQHYHPGHPKAWLKCGITGNILASYNITSVTDSGVGLVGPVFTSAFATVNYSVVVTIERTATGLTVTDQKFVNLRSLSIAPGSFLAECYDGTAVTAVQEDPTAWHFLACGAQV